MNDNLCLGGDGNTRVELNPRMANRHGLIAGAVGSSPGRRIVRGILCSLLGGR